MGAFLYGTALQLKLGIRSKSLLVTYYVVPLLFFALMGGIFTSITPEMKHTLIQSMTVMGVSMGALIGFPPSITETYGSDIKKVYKANGVPLFHGLFSMFLSSFVHILIMSVIIYFIAPVAFDASVPENTVLYFSSLAIFMAVSLSIGCVLGLSVKNQGKLIMFSQLVFLPSIMLSGILFPADLLPEIVNAIAKIFPATWGFQLMMEHGFTFSNLLPLLLLFLAAIIVCGCQLRRLQAE